jgi:deoxyribodipyrimidine photo-lyase
MAPTVQSRKFAAEEYIRTWVPELRSIGDEAIHEPGKQRPADYPEPIVDHRFARQRALTALGAFAEARPARSG